jgi:integrase
VGATASNLKLENGDLMVAKKKAIKLPWDKSNRRFTKMHQGRRWKSSRGLDPKNPTHYRKALAEFLAFCENREALPPQHERAVRLRKQMIRWYERFEQNQSALDKLRAEITEIEQMAKKDEALSVFERDPLRGMSEGGRVIWQDRLQMLERTEATNGGLLSFKKAYADFLAFKSTTVTKGQIAVLKAHVGFFLKCIGDHQPLENLNKDHWELFWAALKQNVNSSKWSNKYGNSVLVSVRGFLRWCYDTERLATLPRFVTSNLYRIEVPNAKPIPFSKKEVRSILVAADDKQRLIYLLMLNCGMTQKDIADLRPAEVSLAKRTITRKRSKHRHRASEKVPTVTYHLWQPTVELLRRFGDFKGERVLKNRSGNPLVEQGVNDSPAAAFRVIRKKLGLRTKTLKTFRKTGTTVLGQKDSPHRAWRSVYLGNAPSGITDKHYDGTDELPKAVTEYIRIHLEIPNSLPELQALAEVTDRKKTRVAPLS